MSGSKQRPRLEAYVTIGELVDLYLYKGIETELHGGKIVTKDKEKAPIESA